MVVFKGSVCFCCVGEDVLHSNLYKKHLMKEKLKGRNVSSIYLARLCTFLGKTEFDVDSFSYSQNLSILLTTLLLTVLGGNGNSVRPCLCVGKGQGIV